MENKKQKLNIFTPVYYDVPSFVELRKNIDQIFQDSVYDIHYYVIDDTAGSDNQINEIKNEKSIHLITPPFNLGHQRAIVYGLREKVHYLSSEEIIVTLDSDGEDAPEDLPRLLSLRQKTEGFVLARRTKRQESLLFKFLYFNFKLLFVSLTGTIIKSGNYMTYKVKNIHNIIHHPYFNLCYSSVFLALRIQLNYVPCERGSRYKGESKMNTVNLISHGIRMLMPFIEKIATRFLVLFSALFLVSLGSSILAASAYLFTDIYVPKSLLIGLLGSLIVSSLSLGNLIVLFTVSAQSMKDSFNFIDKKLAKKPQKDVA